MKESHAKVASAAVKKLASPPKFDTMAAVNTLTKAGIEQGPAGAIVGVVRDAQCELATEESLLSTKFALESDMTILKADLRADMAELRVELRSEMAGLREELKSDVAGLKVELKSDMKSLEVSIEKQFAQLYRHLLVGGGACVATVVGLLSVMMILTRGGGF